MRLTPLPETKVRLDLFCDTLFSLEVIQFFFGSVCSTSVQDEVKVHSPLFLLPEFDVFLTSTNCSIGRFGEL